MDRRTFVTYTPDLTYTPTPQETLVWAAAAWKLMTPLERRDRVAATALPDDAGSSTPDAQINAVYEALRGLGVELIHAVSMETGG